MMAIVTYEILTPECEHFYFHPFHTHYGKSS